VPGFVSNAAFIMKADGGQITSAVIEQNWLNGANYTIYAEGMPGITVINNKFGRDFQFGIRSNMLAENWSGNVREDNGTPAN
jgi:hypothetical protein